MAISLSKKKPKVPKNVAEPKECCSSVKVSLRFLYKIPILVTLLILIYLWFSSTTIISGKNVHFCVSSRKLNSLYCLSAGTQPNFEIPVPLVQNGTDINVEMKIETPSSLVDYLDKGIPSPIVDNSTISSPIDNLDLDEVAPTPLFYSSTISSPIVNLDLDKETPSRTVDNSSIFNPTINEEVKKEIPYPIVENRTIESPIVNEEMKKEIPSPTVRDSVAYPVKAVEEYLHVLRSWTSKKRREGCEGRGIYVYNLPSKFNKDLVEQCSDMVPWIDCKYISNDGLGEAVPKLGKAWYNTHQYSLEPTFHARVMNHPCRVHNEHEAKLFYVPFYGGLDIMKWLFKNVSNDIKDSLGLDLIKWLETQRPWNRNSGKDHVFALGKISYDFRRKENFAWGTSFLELEQMQNPTKILVERKPWHENDIGVPYPTFFHPHSDEDMLTWQAKIMSSERKSLVGFAGAVRPKSTDNLRSILIDQCVSVGDDKCKFLSCSSGGCSQPEPVVELFVESEFCLQPPGDNPTRKSVFDSLVSGCIPVLFDPYTAYYQYPWHLPEDHGKYSVFIDQEKVRQVEINVVERLMKVSKKERDDMRRFIVYELLPGLVYGDADSQFDKFEDAFSITINSLLERVNSLGSS